MNNKPSPRPERIVKIFTGRHIDLDSIVSIGDARIYDGAGCASEMEVSFYIFCKLLDKPIKFARSLKDGEEIFWDREFKDSNIEMVDGSLRSYHGCWNKNGERKNEMLTEQEHKNVLALHNLQKQIDELVTLWKNWVNYKN